jgi:adenosylcobinamide kinase/adenosylcobinamide-phosphate guanylyltransferase
MAKLTLITGGTRSGKSRLAVRLASEKEGAVTFVATLIPGDEAEMRERVKRHRADRPADWETVEEGRNLARVFEGAIWVDTVVVDCLTLYVSNLLLDGCSDEEILKNVARACERMKRSSAEIILVTNEVGWGIVPDHAMGRRFRDVAGLVNQKVAESADEVYLVSCGIPIRIKPQGW